VVNPATGEIIRKRPGAATINAIRARIRDLNVQSPIVPGTAAARLLEEADRRVLMGQVRLRSLPPVSDEPDGAVP